METNKGQFAVVTFATGKEYQKNFSKTFRPSLERYAQKINKEFIVIGDFIRPSSKHTFWQRLLMFENPEIAKYDKVLMVDADIYITKHAKNIFDAVGDKPWGIAPNNAYNLPEYAITDLYYYNDCPKENRPAFACNCGMYVISRSYQEDLAKVYEEYSEKESRGYESGPLNYFLLNENRGIILSSEFNTLVSMYIKKYGHSLSSILKMYDDNSFLHFAASKWRSVFYFIKWLDTTESTTAKKIVRFFGKKDFDPITSVVFSLAQRAVGIYGYRIKKYFSK